MQNDLDDMLKLISKMNQVRIRNEKEVMDGEGASWRSMVPGEFSYKFLLPNTRKITRPKSISSVSKLDEGELDDKVEIKTRARARSMLLS